MKIKIFISLKILAILFLLIVNPVLAQTAVSNPVITAVGNPPADQKPKLGGDALKAARDLFNAYSCTHSSTLKSDTVPQYDCIKNALKSSGYSPDVVNGPFMSELQNSFVGGNSVGLCTQCLGFVQLVLILAGGGTTDFNGPGTGSFTAGNQKYQLRCKGDDRNCFPQSGDVAATFGGSILGGEFAPSPGHDMIVDNVKGIQFTAFEANFNVDPKASSGTCRVQSGDESNSFWHNKTLPYTFYYKVQ